MSQSQEKEKKKKRKRHSKDEERPRKKKTLNGAAETVEFRHVPDLGEWVPAIGKH